MRYNIIHSHNVAENKTKMLCIFWYVHFATEWRKTNKLSNHYYYVTHAVKGVPFVFTDDAAHDNLISQEMHNSRRFAVAVCYFVLLCAAIGQTKLFVRFVDCGNYVLFICWRRGKWNCIATKYQNDTIQMRLYFAWRKTTKLHKIDKRTNNVNEKPNKIETQNENGERNGM